MNVIGDKKFPIQYQSYYKEPYKDNHYHYKDKLNKYKFILLIWSTKQHEIYDYSLKEILEKTYQLIHKFIHKNK